MTAGIQGICNEFLWMDITEVMVGERRGQIANFRSVETIVTAIADQETFSKALLMRSGMVAGASSRL